MTPATETTEWATDIARQAITEHDCYQHPEELAQLLTLLAAVYKPRLVLEIGAGNGGSAWAWAQLPTVTEVISVTLPDPSRIWKCLPHTKDHCVIEGDSRQADTFHKLTTQLGGNRPDFLWIDGDHSYPTAFSDWFTYRQLVGAEGLIALHDIRPESRYPGFEVDRLWAQIKLHCDTDELIAEGDHIAQGTGLVYTWPPIWQKGA